MCASPSVQIESGYTDATTLIRSAAAIVTMAGYNSLCEVLALQQKAVVTREKLGEVDTESFRIADLFKEKLRQANDQMRRHGTDENPEAWQAFLKSFFFRIH